jgi:uncharacterized protein (UPF0332 family)
MKAETAKFLQRAEDCLPDADANFQLDRLLVVVNRSYYCMFDAVRGLLAEAALQPKTHQGVYVKFNEMFVKKGAFSEQHRDNLRAVFELRQSGDYDLDFEPTTENARFALDSANEFLSAVKRYLSH